MNRNTVILDLDGTLLNTLPDITSAANRALSLTGLPVWEEDAYRYFVGDGVFNLCRRAAGEHPEAADRVAELYMPWYHEHSREKTCPYPGIPEALRKLKSAGMKLAVFTNKDQPDAEDVLAFYFPDIRFDYIHGRRENVPIKPDPAAVFTIMDALHTVPARCCYAGDTATDMKCALNAGISPIGVLWGFRTKEELEANGAGALASTPEEMVRLILEEA